MVGLPPCFIGSSSEGEPYAEALRYHLDGAGVPAELWSLGAFAAGDTTIETLDEKMTECSFAAFVVTPDDAVTKRDKLKLAPRDNVVLEYGMFLGRLGRSRTFLIVPKGLSELHLPSDLLGVTLQTYNYKQDAQLKTRRTTMKAIADEIIEEIERQQWLQPAMDGQMVEDLLEGVSRHLDASKARLPGQSNAWVQGVLNTVQERFVNRTEDAYSAWLRPGPDDRLHLVSSSNIPRGYPDQEGWGRDEGLVGRVWVQGQPAAVTKLQRHPWFEEREGCENETYLCAPVGPPGGPGGVLAVGSDNGFVSEPGDLGFIGVYAAVLSLAVNAAAVEANGTIGAAVNDTLRATSRLTKSAYRRVRGY
ncbi:MAG: TIR domain-containing protein [Solirubrobacteraceae bacterium]